MTRTLRRSALLSLLLAAALPAQAYDGEIAFTGNITTTTCYVSTADQHKTVALPSVSTDAFGLGNHWAGRTPFSIRLNGCNNEEIGLYFEPVAGAVHADGTLKNSDASNGGSNIALRLLNADGDTINLNGTSLAEQNGSKLVPIGEDSAGDLHYFVEYYSSAGNATAGAVAASIYFTIVYP